MDGALTFIFIVVMCVIFAAGLIMPIAYFEGNLIAVKRGWTCTQSKMIGKEPERVEVCTQYTHEDLP